MKMQDFFLSSLNVEIIVNCQFFNSQQCKGIPSAFFIQYRLFVFENLQIRVLHIL